MFMAAMEILEETTTVFQVSVMRIQMEKNGRRGWDTTQLCMWSGWWQLKYIVCSSLFGKIPILTNMFQMG